LKAGDLVKIYARGVQTAGEVGLAVFLRRVLPENDLSKDHSFWKDQDISHLSMAQLWHNEVLYCGIVHLLVEKQFILIPTKDEDAGDR
jgi:hypothetical protein|tara:strand:+ start:3901 stop:4164 length:264 start_codon:yes stop_codon:yes gene_type:complete